MHGIAARGPPFPSGAKIKATGWSSQGRGPLPSSIRMSPFQNPLVKWRSMGPWAGKQAAGWRSAYCLAGLCPHQGSLIKALFAGAQRNDATVDPPHGRASSRIPSRRKKRHNTKCRSIEKTAFLYGFDKNPEQVFYCFSQSST